MPVVASFTADATQQILNTNADSIAAAIASALGAEKLFFVLKAPGLLSNPEDRAQPVAAGRSGRRSTELEASGAIQSGMRPKIAAARAALAGGVTSVHLVSGLAARCHPRGGLHERGQRHDGGRATSIRDKPVNGAQLLEFLVSVPSISGNERDLADQLSRHSGGEGFNVQREGDSLWFSIGSEASAASSLAQPHRHRAGVRGLEHRCAEAIAGDGRLTGLGANDAKGCVAAMILAARDLQTVPLEGRVTFAFVAQEETGGDGIRR